MQALVAESHTGQFLVRTTLTFNPEMTPKLLKDRCIKKQFSDFKDGLTDKNVQIQNGKSKKKVLASDKCLSKQVHFYQKKRASNS